MKYIAVTGGVVSGLGKGVTISSMGRMLQASGVKVTAIKIDPYLNVDAGTMSPFEHGEVFVLADGGESDLDLGNYERFLGITLTSDHNITTGKVYRKVILAERKGDYLGKTVQVVPHITDCIQDWIERVAQIPVDPSGQVAEVCLIEVGGTVGDIESSVFLEALRQFQFRVGFENFCLCFVSLVPVLSDEQKTKPTQHGVRDLRSLGLSPQVIFCRSTEPLLDATKQKISLFCHVPASNVLSVHDVSNVYFVPSLLKSQNLHMILQEELQFGRSLIPGLTSWTVMAKSIETATQEVTIALIGKYNGLQDSYLSVIKALRHASIACHVRLNLEWVEASSLESDTAEGHAEAWDKVKAAQGVIIPGGFGSRGWEGKIIAANYCRENKVPLLGVCLGFQAIVVEYCRNVLFWEKADSTEFDENTAHPVVIFMPEIDKETMGGTMRLGARNTKFTHKYEDGSMSTAQVLYGGKEIISERHRHRYEVNPEKVEAVHSNGLLLVGRDESGERMEIAELPRAVHPFYIGCQFHPEFLSRPLAPSPPFHGLILAAAGQLDDYLKKNMK
ncbi:CTP synthase [Fistulifera solaris]|uniref:CTP synthase n=1 Tax=Fistulifera solaris TaxID=1519565 RepID=A0A1Z5KC22_FISSO|nr:CTP synthase [Fistulifera solaris]|eukprot:GAX23448.1 CTP synthase [Fistulifera solaris]